VHTVPCRFMWVIRFMGLLSLLVYAPAQGSEVFQCPDGRGGWVLRDVPCSITAPGQPESTEPARPRAPAAPSPRQRKPSAPPDTTQLQGNECLKVQGVKAQVQRGDQLAAELAWEAVVKNHCAQPASALLTFTIYGGKNLTLDTESTKVIVAARSAETVHGLLRVPREKMRHMRKYDAKLAAL